MRAKTCQIVSGLVACTTVWPYFLESRQGAPVGLLGVAEDVVPLSVPFSFLIFPGGMPVLTVVVFPKPAQDLWSASLLGLI